MSITISSLQKLSRYLVVIIFLIFCLFKITLAQPQKSRYYPINNLNRNGYLRDWIIVGPFPNPLTEEPQPDGSSQLGFYKDYLHSIGGEGKAVLDTAIAIEFLDEQNTAHSVRPKLIKAGENGLIDFEKLLARIDYQVAYAFCYLYSETDQTAAFLFGSDDGAKVWINRERVHFIDAARGLTYRSDRFKARLHKGLNRMLVKISQWEREWAFVVEAVDQKTYAEIEAKEKAREDFNRFLNCRLIPEKINTWNYVFGPGKFPKLQWEQPELAEKVLGKFPLTVRWFDSRLNEVSKAETTGRYAFYAEGTGPNGIHIRRAGTMYCMPWDWMAWAERPKAHLNYIPLQNFDKKAWHEHREAIADFSGRIILLSMLNQQEGAILLSYLDEMKSTGKPVKLTDTPIIFDQDYHLALKRKILGVEDKWPALKMPQKTPGKPATILHEASEAEAGMKPGTAEKIRTVCQKWYQESREPFIVLVARHGVIFLHEAFGENPAGKVTLETTTEMASLTKLVTGLLFAQFVDQGLIGIDDPVGKFLPDFPVSGEKALTIRHLFTHTSGLWGHEEWGGLHSPWLDNKVANILNELQVGKQHNYNGMGYDLAGKVMEMVSGKSIFRLFREHLFDPLGLNNTTLEEDLGFSCFSNAGEFARLGQLLLNKGSYGNLKFFSPATFEQLQPKPLNQFYPGINVEWGIGITWMRQSHPDAGKNGIPTDQTILSKNVIGHGSATSAILRVDLDNDLVICQTRRRGGKAYEKYLAEFLMAIEGGIK